MFSSHSTATLSRTAIIPDSAGLETNDVFSSNSTNKSDMPRVADVEFLIHRFIVQPDLADTLNNAVEAMAERGQQRG